VEVNGQRVTELVLADPSVELLIQAGRRWSRVTL